MRAGTARKIPDFIQNGIIAGTSPGMLRLKPREAMEVKFS